MKIANAFSLSMISGNAIILTKEVSLEKVQEMAKEGVQSYVGHADTAAVLTSMIGYPVPMNRVNLSLGTGDRVVVAQVQGGRLPEGATTLPEGATMKFVEVTVGVRGLTVTHDSHLDHGVDGKLLAFILEKYKDADRFFIDTFPTPEGMRRLDCGLHGPAVGDDPVPESEVTYGVRGDRKWKSRLVPRPHMPSDVVTVIGGPDGSGRIVLYTVYGGPLAPREPGDSYFEQPGKEAESEASKAFWAEHALSP